MPEHTAEHGRLQPVVATAVARAGFELDQLEVAGAGGQRQLRVVVDSDDGVDADEIATVSRAVSAELDRREELLPGPYTLEVTSPGLDRPLTRPRHWRRHRLRLVRARLLDGTELVGRVGASDDEAVTMLVAGTPRRVSYSEVAHAVVEVEFDPPPAEELAVLADPQQPS